MTYTTRQFEDRDLPQVLDVLAASLGETTLLRRTEELFSWKHLSNPFGRSIVMVAVAGDRIAGVRAIMRWALVDPLGNRVECGRMVDTATHPDFQRMGIFRRLTMEAVEEASSRGIRLLFNTPNTESGPGYLTMGWEPVGPIGVMLRPSPRIFARSPDLGSRLAEPAEFFREPPPAADTDAIGDRLPMGLRTPRSAEYLHWRYRSHPTARYVVTGDGRGAVAARLNHRSGRRELVVSDLVGPAAGPALSGLLRRHRAGYAVAWFSAGTPERRLAIRLGLMPVPGVKALTLVARPLADIGVDVHQPGTWDLAMGDLELL